VVTLLSRKFHVPVLDPAGEDTRGYRSVARYFTEDLGSGVSLEMALIPGGSFEMGSDVQKSFPDLAEQPIHPVTIKAFAIGVFPVTRRLWRRVMKLPRIANDMVNIMPDTGGDEFPADAVFKHSIAEFLARVAQHSGRRYRLPSEAEWEYACRAGTKTSYHFGEVINRSVAIYGDGPPQPSREPVGSKKTPNRFGLHDMHGGVLETCEDLRNDTYAGAPSDGGAWLTSPYAAYSAIARGGCFLFGADGVRAARRYAFGNVAAAGLGFRVALDLDCGFVDTKLDCISNAASRRAGAVAPGEIVTIEGRGFALPSEAMLSGAGVALDPETVDGVHVRVSGVACPILFLSEKEIRAVIPNGVAGKQEVQIIVDAQGQSSMPVAVDVAEASPGLFTVDQTGRGIAAAINEDGSTHSEGNPAARGSRLSLFGTGEGQTDPPGVDGRIADPGAWPIPRPVLPVAVRIGGVECEILYAGGESGQIAGLLRVDVRVPAELPNLGILPVVMQIGAASSQDEVFVAVG
jgi:uncharacterized protein (TIGR03437 family)